MLDKTSKHDASKQEKKDLILERCAVATVILSILQVAIGILSLCVTLRG